MTHLNKTIRTYIEVSIFLFFLFTTLYGSKTTIGFQTKGLDTNNLTDLNLNQTADIKIIFLGVPSNYIDQSTFLDKVPLNVTQFDLYESNTKTRVYMEWNLNVTLDFQDFPEDAFNTLNDTAFRSEGVTYYNSTLLEELLSQVESLSVQKQGYLYVFMWLPNNGLNHSWYHLSEGQEEDLGGTLYINGQSSKPWTFKSQFGGTEGVVYSDISNLMNRNPTQQEVTDLTVYQFRYALEDMFCHLMGETATSQGDYRWIASDLQRYENYHVKILWLNGTSNLICTDRIKSAFEDLMPWTNWTISAEAKPMDVELDSFLKSYTSELNDSYNYTVVYRNDSVYSREWTRALHWLGPIDTDPINEYLFNYVVEYFHLTDLEDKSIIPVILFQAGKDTILDLGGFDKRIAAGVCHFPHNAVIVGLSGSESSKNPQSSSLRLIRRLIHEIGHWVGQSHHSMPEQMLPAPMVFCSMQYGIGGYDVSRDSYCTFCKHTRARMSFISWYNATLDLLSKQEMPPFGVQESFDEAVQLFYDWDYSQAISVLIAVYRTLESQFPISPLIILGGVIVAAVVVIVTISLIFFKKKSYKKSIT